MVKPQFLSTGDNDLPITNSWDRELRFGTMRQLNLCLLDSYTMVIHLLFSRPYAEAFCRPSHS